MQIVSPKPALGQTVIFAAFDLEQMQRRPIREDGGRMAKSQFG